MATRQPAAGAIPEGFHTLQREGLGLLDVGARDGLHPLFRAIAPLVHALGVEPDREECARLQAEPPTVSWRSVRYLPFALGGSDGQATFHVCRSRGANSLYRPNHRWLSRFPDPARYEVVCTQTVPVRALDTLRQDPTLPIPPAIDFIKLDIQGAELDVLQCARQILDREVVGLEVEVEFAPVYEGQPLFRDIDAFLASCGFSLFKLRRKSWVRRVCAERPAVSAGQLIAADALYLRDPLTLEPEARRAWSAHRLEALLLVAALYDLHDFCLELVADPILAARVDVEAIARYVGRRACGLDYRLNGDGWFLSGARLAKECFKGRSGFGNLYAWRLRRSWGRADSDKDFYTRT